MSQEGTPLTTMMDDGNALISVVQHPPHNRTKYDIALPVVLGDLMNPDIPPVVYLKAAGESLFLTLLLSWVCTYVVDPESIHDNPLKTRLGYNNLCVGWDVAPAKYVASVLWVFVAYLCIRFTTMEAIRFRLQQKTAITFQKVANLLFFVAVLCFTLCLMIPPTQSVWLHTLPFIGFMITRYLIVLALCVDEYEALHVKTKIFLVVYGMISVSLPIIYISEYAYYAEYGEKSPWPWQITFALDYSWFAALAVTSKFIPSNIVIHRSFALLEYKEDGSALMYKSRTSELV